MHCFYDAHGGVYAQDDAGEELSKWDELKEQYRYDDQVNQLVFVQYIGKSKATVKFYVKTADNKWKHVFTETGAVGRKGIGKNKEGDQKTPKGVYNLTMPFGNRKNPGAKQKYLKVNKNHYWCSDKKYYNKLINIKKKPHKCKGEHLYYYGKAYGYAMFVDYNVECKYPKGSAIFLHVKSAKGGTSGCIAISETNMKKIIKKADYGTKICIFKK